MKKTSLMTATALAALLAASPVLAQGMDAPATPAEPPAVETMPETTTPPVDAMPAPETNMPDALAPSTPDTAAAPAEIFLDQQASGELLASSLIGASVMNSADESLGSISDLILSPEGSVEGVVVGVGGFLGIGAKQVAIAFSEIDHAKDANGNDILRLDVTAEQLEAAPAYVTVEEETDAVTTPAAPSPVSP